MPTATLPEGWTERPPPPSLPGLQKIGRDYRQYWCNCVLHCSGMMTPVVKSTYFAHRGPNPGGSRSRARTNRGLRDCSEGANAGGLIQEPEPLFPEPEEPLGGPVGEPEGSGQWVGQGVQEPVRDMVDEDMVGGPNPDPGEPEGEPLNDSVPETELVASLEDLKLALDYIAALKDAKLETSGLDKTVLQRLKNPVVGLLDFDDDLDLKLSIRLYMDLGSLAGVPSLLAPQVDTPNATPATTPAVGGRGTGVYQVSTSTAKKYWSLFGCWWKNQPGNKSRSTNECNNAWDVLPESVKAKWEEKAELYKSRKLDVALRAEVRKGV